MMLRTYTPGPPLAEFVAFFWLYEHDGPPHAKERRLPTGTMELVINLREDTIPVYDRRDPSRCRRFRGGVFSGTHTEHVVIDTASQASTLGVHFKPGGAFPFLGRPASELRDAHVSLDTLWGRAADALRERLLAAETPAAKFRVLEAALLARADRPLERDPAVAYALNAFRRGAGTPAVSDVAAQVGFSHRHFIQRFREEVGLTPKLFCRVRRFQGVLRRLDERQDVDWAGVALACGYYDQAHLIRDFRAFSGITPTTYVAHRAAHRNHVPLHT